MFLHCWDEQADRKPCLHCSSLLASSKGSIPGQQLCSPVICSTAQICAHSCFELAFRKSNTQRALEVDKKKLQQLFSTPVTWESLCYRSAQSVHLNLLTAFWRGHLHRWTIRHCLNALTASDWHNGLWHSAITSHTAKQFCKGTSTWKHCVPAEVRDEHMHRQENT